MLTTNAPSKRAVLIHSLPDAAPADHRPHPVTRLYRAGSPYASRSTAVSRHPVTCTDRWRLVNHNSALIRRRDTRSQSWHARLLKPERGRKHPHQRPQKPQTYLAVQHDGGSKCGRVAVLRKGTLAGSGAEWRRCWRRKSRSTHRSASETIHTDRRSRLG